MGLTREGWGRPHFGRSPVRKTDSGGHGGRRGGLWELAGERNGAEKKLSNIYVVCVVSGKSHSSPWLALSDTTYSNVVSVHIENTTDIYNLTSPFIPQVAHVCLTLHGECFIRYDNVFTSCKRDHKTFLDPHALGVWSWPVAR
jgi:hypothetical protein